MTHDGRVAIQLGIPERGETTKTGPRQGVLIDFERTKRFLRERKALPISVLPFPRKRSEGESKVRGKPTTFPIFRSLKGKGRKG